MKSSLGDDYSTEQSLNFAATPVLPKDFHIFRRCEPGANPGLPNVHNRFVLWFCTSGRGTLVVDKISYVLAAGELFLVFPGQPHIRMPLDGQKVEYRAIRFAMSNPPEWLKALRDRVIESDSVIRQRIANLFRIREKALKSMNDKNLCEGILTLGLLLNDLRDANTAVPFAACAMNRSVRKLCEMIVSAQVSELSFADAARQLGISSGHLRREFKNATGHAPQTVKQNMRMLTAQHLLTHSSLNVTEIAHKLGFRSVYSFSRFFRHHAGVPPTRYRTGGAGRA